MLVSLSVLEQYLPPSLHPRSTRLEAIEERLSQLLSRMESQPSATTPPATMETAAKPEGQQRTADSPAEGVGLLELQRMLMTLQHMEDKEDQMRSVFLPRLRGFSPASV